MPVAANAHIGSSQPICQHSKWKEENFISCMNLLSWRLCRHISPECIQYSLKFLTWPTLDIPDWKGMFEALTSQSSG